jgi:rhodanese-related sulfurtransferase
MTHTWQLELRLLPLVIAGLAGVQSAAAQSSEGQTGLVIHVRNYAEVEAKRLVKAKNVASGIFRKAGVETSWVDVRDTPQDQSDNSANPSLNSLLDIRLHIVSSTMGERLALPSNVMGLTPGSGSDRRLVYVFYDSVRQLSERQLQAQSKGDISLHASAEQILGEMIAHEIGHLLLNMPSHSKTGIMRGAWDLKDLSDIAYSSLIFTRSQAEIMRKEIRRRSNP